MSTILEKNQRLGNYSLIEQIAVGGMAEVWSASDADGKKVALKILRAAAASKNLKSMWADEVKLAVRLRHPNIVRVEGTFEDNGFLVQIMELIDGRDLRRILSSASKVRAHAPIPVALTLARDLARALGYAHASRGPDGNSLAIIHRDVSPHNVMLTKDGRVKLIDFGIARANDRLTKTAAGVIKGKVSYMAPEQALGAEISPRTDIFALGIVVWELLSLQRLFKGDNDAIIFQQICEGKVPPIGTIRPDVPGPIQDLLRRMLALHPRERPESMKEVDAGFSRELLENAGIAEPSEIAAWAAPFVDAKRKKTAQLPQQTIKTLTPDFEEDDESGDTFADPTTAPEAEDAFRGALLAPAVIRESGSHRSQPDAPPPVPPETLVSPPPALENLPPTEALSPPAELRALGKSALPDTKSPVVEPRVLRAPEAPLGMRPPLEQAETVPDTNMSRQQVMGDATIPGPWPLDPVQPVNKIRIAGAIPVASFKVVDLRKEPVTESDPALQKRATRPSAAANRVQLLVVAALASAAVVLSWLTFVRR